jgi:Zn-dependent alcohol dehydrogenase
VLGSFSGQAKAYWKALEFVSKHLHEVPFDRMVTNRYTLDDVNVALTRMKNFEEIKPIITL